ncbi:MAG: hypothetical protein HYX65_07635 [Gemmatimonadetes bacterium]|nr:hypothetical protein [Gemmatimonadota bacterium]
MSAGGSQRGAAGARRRGGGPSSRVHCARLGAVAWRRGTDAWRLGVALALVAAGLAIPAHAQDARATAEHDRADALIERGQLFAAESVYYGAVKGRPRDPWARLNLARHVMARGAARVASALYEEARFFGADPRLFVGELAFAYERAGQWRALVTMPGSTLPRGEVRRAEWMQAHAAAARGADSTSVAWVPARDDTVAVAAIGATIGADTATLFADPLVRGVVVDTAWLRRPAVRVFTDGGTAPRASATVAVIDSLAIGGLRLVNVPARVAPQPRARGIRVGLDWLGDRGATFDPGAGRIVLRRTPGDARTIPGARVPTVHTADGLCLVLDGLVPFAGARAITMLGARRWTVLGARGEIAVAR